MSIFCTTVRFDAADHGETCARWQPATGKDWQMAVDGRYYRRDDTIPCTCAAGPIVYQGSHILPADTDPRGGHLDLGEIPGFITRAGRPLVCDEETCTKPATECCDRVWPWLRVGVGDNERTVVLLDRDQVTELHRYLGGWLQRAVPDSADRVEATP